MEKGKRPQTEEQRQKQTISRFKGEDFKLREELKIVKEENRILKEKLEKALLLIEELQRMVFKKKGKEDKNNDTFDQQEKSKQPDRPASSYRRQAPKEEEITKEEECKLDCCPDCHNELTKLKTSEFFIEDVLPPQEWYKALKEVTRRKITTGYCAHCEKRITPVSIPKQKVSLGENIRELIVFQSTVQQLSYSQILDFSQAVLHIDLSEGELAHILQTQSFELKSSYAVILENIRSQKVVHMDETGWPTHKGEQGNFAWVVCSAKSLDVAYSLGRSRGKGNIEKLLGKNYDGIGITDNYGGY